MRKRFLGLKRFLERKKFLNNKENKPRGDTRWGVVNGSWGDVIAGLQFFRDRIGRGNVIYYGDDPSIAEFLRCQSFIDEVIFVAPSASVDPLEIHFSVWGNGGRLSSSILEELEPCGVPRDLLVGCGFDWNHPHPTCIREPLSLPEEVERWAQTQVGDRGKPTYLLMPYSFHSTRKEDHWPHWYEFMQTLFAASDAQFILAGQAWSGKPFEKHVNVKNLIGQTPTMMHVMALARFCRATITTSNGLGLWCGSQTLPAIVIANQECSDDTQYFAKVFQNLASWPGFQVAKVSTHPRVIMHRLQHNYAIDFNGNLPYTIDSEARLPKDFSYIPMSESRKFTHLVAPYLLGDGIDLGAGGDPIVPRAISVDLIPERGQLVGDACQLKWFKDDSLDYIYSSHLLGCLNDWDMALREWMRVIKPGGYLIIQIPDHRRLTAFEGAGQTVYGTRNGSVGELTKIVGSIGGWGVIRDSYAHPIDYNILFVAQKNLKQESFITEREKVDAVRLENVE